ncbi:hypothetical protein CCHR01_16411 [Colletotrichum chrysophilum]|uniref:Uncharacterized protein n=1 Tax=Colletotrichum chrysophilum TaxID=1836956 RepID=A0AAD9EDH6_9PEZI|nr:hypothetical protein CCHR01_16411 [Colletotrichum chrysophilum]
MQREAFLALYLVFIYSYFPDFHALIFDFYNDLAEFYSHTCGFISFSNAVYHAQGLPGRSSDLWVSFFIDNDPISNAGFSSMLFFRLII